MDAAVAQLLEETNFFFFGFGERVLPDRKVETFGFSL